MFVIPYESKEDNSNDLSIEYGVHGQKVRLDKSLEKDAIEKIRLILAAHDEKIKRGEEERRKSEEKVKTGLSKYIEDVFTNLKESEKRNKKFAFWLYLVSIVSLIATIVIAVIFVANRDWQTENIGYMIAYGVTCLFIIIILISLSKLLFTLAKSFMVEAIRCSDRIHAISFGKFFLDAYGAEASREEVLKAFSSWNIDSRLYELILNWHKYDSAQRGDTAEEIAFYRLLNLFMDDSGRYEIAKPLLDKCYIEELEVKKTEGEKLLNDLVGAELPDGTHSEEFPAIKQRYFDIAKEFSKMLKTVINCQLEELLCKSN